MPSHTEGLLTDSRQDFCLALRAARERKGITLAQIASATKIPADLFAALERNDLRRWPNGLFRRSFFRDYAKAVGLPVADASEQFVRLFCEGPAPSTKRDEATPDAPGTDEVRLVLDARWHGPRAPIVARLLAAVGDATMVWLIALAVAWSSGFGLLATVGVVTLAYYFVATVSLGESPARWVVSQPWLTLAALRRGPGAIAAGCGRAIGEIRQLSSWLSQQPAEEKVEEPGEREWVSDARRVGEPRLRVRIKVPH